MMTSNVPTLPPRIPLRLRIADPPGRSSLAGGWWPQSRDLAVELPDLVDNFPSERGQVLRVAFSSPDWDTAPLLVPVASGHVEVASFPSDDKHVVELTMADLSLVRLMVVPPRMSAYRGEEAMLAAATPHGTHSAASILATVTEADEVDPFDHWHDEGGSWWGPDQVAPSFRETRPEPPDSNV
jgi:hypothetical protein